LNAAEEAVQRLTGDERLKELHLLNTEAAKLIAAHPRFAKLHGRFNVELRGHQFFVLLRDDATTKVLGVATDPREAIRQALATAKRLGL